MSTDGITSYCIDELPIAVVDFETTGLAAGHDRVVEVAVVRVEPGQGPELTFNTLVNPCRPMAATEIHGISDLDVVDAPPFSAIAGDFVRSIAGAVVTAYNAYFDMRFLEYETRNVGVECAPPHFCLMYLRPMLGVGARCCLDDACRIHRVPRSSAHESWSDALAAAELLSYLLREAKTRQVRTYADLAALHDYKFVRSFQRAPVDGELVAHMKPCTARKARGVGKHEEISLARPIESPRNPVATYWDALKVALSDLQVTDSEIEQLVAIVRQSKLPPEQIRAIHARVFAAIMCQFADDRSLDDAEVGVLQRIRTGLHRLGWAPGD